MSDETSNGGTSPDRRRPWTAWGKTLAWLYGLSALPILLLCAFFVWANSKQQYDGEPFDPSTIPFLVGVAAIPVAWLIGAFGAANMSSRGRPWEKWASVFLFIPVLIVGAWYVFALVVSPVIGA